MGACCFSAACLVCVHAQDNRQRNQWACEVCTFLNTDANPIACEMCGSQRVRVSSRKRIHACVCWL